MTAALVAQGAQEEAQEVEALKAAMVRFRSCSHSQCQLIC
jgi:hypothetical protein